MARSRNIKPGFFTNDELAEIEPLGRLTFIGLWTIADREGRLEDRPKKIKVEILPYDDVNVDEMLNQLADKGFILRYEVNGNKYIQIANFIKHQNPHHKEVASMIPAPFIVENKDSDAQTVHEETKVQDQLMLKSSMDQPCRENETCLTQEEQPDRADSLNLIPDSFNRIPDTIAIHGSLPVDNFSCGEGSGDGEKPNTDFMIFWNEYPRHSGMNKAVEAWNELMKRGIPPNDVVRAAKKYRNKVKMEKTAEDYVKMPHTFLATGFFKDYAPVFSPDCQECKGNGFVPVDRDKPTGTMAECSCKRRLDIA